MWYNHLREKKRKTWFNCFKRNWEAVEGNFFNIYRNFGYSKNSDHFLATIDLNNNWLYFFYTIISILIEIMFSQSNQSLKIMNDSAHYVNFLLAKNILSLLQGMDLSLVWKNNKIRFCIENNDRDVKTFLSGLVSVKVVVEQRVVSRALWRFVQDR